MTKGMTKQKFNSFKRYYDPEIFCEASKRMRAMARSWYVKEILATKER